MNKETKPQSKLPYFSNTSNGIIGFTAFLVICVVAFMAFLALIISKAPTVSKEHDLKMATLGYEQKTVPRLNSSGKPNGIVDIVWVKTKE